jgi:hypothetical protein
MVQAAIAAVSQRLAVMEVVMDAAMEALREAAMEALIERQPDQARQPDQVGQF